MNRLIHPYQLGQLTAALFKELIREPGVLFWGIAFPILMSLGLGVAFTKKPDVTRTVAIINKTNETAATPKDSTILHFLGEFGNINRTVRKGKPVYELRLPDKTLGNTLIIFEEMNWNDAMIQLKRGTLNLVLVNNGNKPEYHFDPVNPDAQLTFLKLTRIFGHRLVPQDVKEAVVQPLTIEGTRYIDFLVPGLIGMGVMMSCMWGLSYGIIDKRSKKLLRRMVATPMRRSHFLVALMTVRLGMNAVEASLLFIFAYFTFGITILGSVPALLTLFIASNICFAGIAIFISSHTSNTEIGNGLINAVVMPMMVLSGVFFSYHNFPDWAIPAIQKLPLTMVADGLRSIFIEGAGFTEIMLPVVVLLATGIAFFVAGMKIFKWH